MAALLRNGQTALEENAVKANELLLWLSARRQGSWRQFRTAVEELHTGDNDPQSNGTASNGEVEFPMHQQLRLDLERLAHVEFFAQDCEEGWRVTPPTLAMHPVKTGMRAVLCGARSPALRERILRIGEKVGCEMLDSRSVPSVIRFISPDTAALAEVAAHAGVYFQPDAPLAILSHLPPCDLPRGNKQTELPVGADWRIREFDPIGLHWRETDRQHAQTARTGLFEFQHYRQWLYFLRRKRMTFKMGRGVALYALLSRTRRDLLRYDTATQTLRLPAICRPPRLLERALVLCSGLPPLYDAKTGSLGYIDVPSDIARFAAELLRQPLASKETT
jgi:hypothetical protein